MHLMLFLCGCCGRVKENVVKHGIESARVSYTFKSAAASEDEPAGSTSGHRENLGGGREADLLYIHTSIAFIHPT